MDERERAGREAMVAQARRWIGTPYHPEADILGAGVDCGMILVRAGVDAGLVAPFDPRPYPKDWMLHQDGEKFVDIVLSITPHEFDPVVRPARAGDVVVWKFGRTYSHGAIVTGAPGTLSGWPWVVHAFADAGMVEEIDTTGAAFTRMGALPRPVRGFSLWAV